MRYTDEDEQRVYEAINRVVAKEMRPPSRLPQDEFMRHIARVALDAMEREPLEDVLSDARIYDVYVLSVTLSDGTNAWEAQIMEPKRDRRWATGATIDEAIRNAVAAAKEGE